MSSKTTFSVDCATSLGFRRTVFPAAKAPTSGPGRMEKTFVLHLTEQELNGKIPSANDEDGSQWLG